MRRIVPIFLATVILSGCAAVGLMPYQIEARSNRNNLAKLEIGMSEQAVLDLMGKPRSREAYSRDDGSVITVLFYYTDTVTSDGNVTRDEMTPVCLRDKSLIGWGQDYYALNIRILGP